MDRARYVVDAVVIEGRSIREVARSHGISKSWVAALVARYRDGGYDALTPQSKRPHSIPRRTSDELEDEIVLLRKHLVEEGFDAGPHTIHYHLSKRHRDVPSVSTIWRVLSRRGFVVPQPQKQPRSSFIRFEASLPNECWQADITHWKLADGSEVDILDFIDDHSRLIVAAAVRRTTKATDVTATFHTAAATWGYPASVLTDNGAVFNARSRRGVTVLETELKALGIVYKHSRPYHPQTCGKIERWHQTLKRFLAKQRPARTVAALQAQVDHFVRYYNEERPHRARERQTPQAAFAARDKARPGTPIATIHYRVRTDKVDSGGNVTLRHDSRLFHIGIGRPFAGTPIKLYVADLEVRVLTEDGKLLRELTLDTSRIYQPRGKGRKT
jgi:transposase InsO family protein